MKVEMNESGMSASIGGGDELPADEALRHVKKSNILRYLGLILGIVALMSPLGSLICQTALNILYEAVFNSSYLLNEVYSLLLRLVSRGSDVIALVCGIFSIVIYVEKRSSPNLVGMILSIVGIVITVLVGAVIPVIRIVIQML